MKPASFNLENLFDRAVALNQPTLAQGKRALEEVPRLDTIYAKARYGDTDRADIPNSLGNPGY
jgi:hypothetical protein